MAWTQQDLERLAAAVDTLQQLDVWSVSILGEGRPCVQVSREVLAGVARATGCRPELRPMPQWGDYQAIVKFGRDYRISAIFRPEHLPMIGYRAPRMPQPVPITEEAETDDDVSD